jgi:hypothetical protein
MVSWCHRGRHLPAVDLHCSSLSNGCPIRQAPTREACDRIEARDEYLNGTIWPPMVRIPIKESTGTKDRSAYSLWTAFRSHFVQCLQDKIEWRALLKSLLE